MINGKKVLAIIPARAGSKRVVNKNIRELAGIPLIGWSLKDLSKSKYIDHSYVSTDSLEIQSLAQIYGIDSHPLRDKELAQDISSTIDVVLDIIENKKKGFDIIVLLQPTSPLRTVADIDNALEFFIEKSANSVISVCKAEFHPSWCAPLPEDMNMSKLVENLQIKRTQDLETHFRLNGAIYISRYEALKNNKSFFSSQDIYAFEMGPLCSVDIDTEEDFILASSLIATLRK